MQDASSSTRWRPRVFDLSHLPPHPVSVCEPLSLGYCRRPKVTYSLLPFPPTLSDPSPVSNMQVETARAACQSLLGRGAFLLGDGTGVGKSRTISLIVREFATEERPVLWLSASASLFEPAKKEMESVGVSPSLVVFSGYQSLLRRYESLSSRPYSLLVFDECHLLRNEKTKTSRLAIDLLHLFEKTPVLYSSATAASLPSHLKYLFRMGMWGEDTSFRDERDFSSSLRTIGPTLMELLSLEMLSRGMYLARHLDFSSVSVSVRTVSLSASERRVYDSFAARRLPQSFFQRLLSHFKLEAALSFAKAKVEEGRSVVFSLVHTGEAAAFSEEEDEENDETKEEDEENDEEGGGDDDEEERLLSLVYSPIDRILSYFGGKDNVSELSGRRKRKKVSCRQRGGKRSLWETKPSTLSEAARFQSDETRVAVLTKAGGIGLSLHGERPRTHIVLELPWGAEQFVQQLGRTYRSSSSHPPEYVLFKTDVPAEDRFSYAITSKLKSMGAFVRGDRRSFTGCDMRPPEWTADAKRKFALLLSLSSSLSSLLPGETTSESSSRPPLRGRRLDFRRQTRERERSEKKEAERLILQLRERARGDDPFLVVGTSLHPVDSEREDGCRRLLSEAESLFPTVWHSCFPWTEERHTRWPLSVQTQIRTLLLCHRSFEASGTLGLLPHPVLLHVCSFLAFPPSDPEKIASHLEKGGLSLSRLDETPNERLFHQIFSMPIQMQRETVRLLSLFDGEGASFSPPPSDFVDYLRLRSGRGILPVLTDVGETREGHLRVKVRYDPVSFPSPPPSSRFWTRKESESSKGYVVAHDASSFSSLLFPDGRRVEGVDEGEILSRGFVPSSLSEWEEETRLLEARRHHRCSNLQKTFLLATEQMTLLWERSAKRILRIPPSSEWEGCVGLLLLR